METLPRLTALRDFHAAHDGPAMAAAVAALGGPALDGEGTEALEFAFNRLFVGPAAPIAPPYASAWLDPERRLMGDVTGRVAALYDTIGLRSPLAGSVPDDHLALELDAALVLAALAGDVTAPLPSHAPVALVRRWFAEEHLALWLPQFIARVEAAADLPPALHHVNRCLADWLDSERRAVAGAAAPDSTVSTDSSVSKEPA